ncbi:shootin-1 isoform X1 [Senna tora]|uniref:Shootin-1 isoform X1 n=1 Tax=Senna tora TaxID=362788 RepID=A0A834SV13_9FABA|nr:shootin-1 isoform X1 [Senna tora]
MKCGKAKTVWGKYSILEGEMVMELLKLSKFKLQLQALITEVRELRERERLALEQHQHGIEKQKQAEEEYNRKIQELQAELASVKEERQKQERRVNYLQNDNALLENKQKELKDTIYSLLQSKESFVHAYEETTSELRHSIETKDRKLSVLSEKLNTHVLLFNSIEKEKYAHLWVLGRIIEVPLPIHIFYVYTFLLAAAGLRNKMDQISAFEKEFVAGRHSLFSPENISDLRKRLENNEEELRRKDKVISELEAKLDVAKLSDNSQAQIDDISSPTWNSYWIKGYSVPYCNIKKKLERTWRWKKLVNKSSFGKFISPRVGVGDIAQNEEKDQELTGSPS